MADDRRGVRPLFGADDSNWMTNACLNFGNPEIGYVTGFRKAADLAVDHVEETGRDQDYLVYPIVFGYRQYLELRLKGLLRGATHLLALPDPPAKVMGRHCLRPVWAELRPRLAEIFPAEVDRFDVIGARLDEFDVVDPDSFSFRYATTKSGASTLPDDLRHINLSRLREGISAIADNLDAAHVGIRVYLDDQAERAAHEALMTEPIGGGQIRV